MPAAISHKMIAVRDSLIGDGADGGTKPGIALLGKGGGTPLPVLAGGDLVPGAFFCIVI